MKIIFVIFYVLLAVSLSFSLDSKVGRVEWTENGPIIYAKGFGSINPQMPLAVQRPAVIEVAKVAGLRSALEIIKSINLNSETTIENRMREDNVTVEINDGALKYYEVGEPKYYRDGTVELEVKVELFKNEDFIKQFLPKQDKTKSRKKKKKYKSRGKEYSGLIIDCGNFDISPSILVEISSEKYGIVYSSMIAKNDDVYKKSGMVAYVQNIQLARVLKDRVGDNPLLISAKKINGVAKTDISISNDDAKKLRLNKKNLKIFEECRVVFVSEMFH